MLGYWKCMDGLLDHNHSMTFVLDLNSINNTNNTKFITSSSQEWAGNNADYDA